MLQAADMRCTGCVTGACRSGICSLVMSMVSMVSFALSTVVVVDRASLLIYGPHGIWIEVTGRRRRCRYGTHPRTRTLFSSSNVRLACPIGLDGVH